MKSVYVIRFKDVLECNNISTVFFEYMSYMYQIEEIKNDMLNGNDKKIPAYYYSKLKEKIEKIENDYFKNIFLRGPFYTRKLIEN